MNRASHSQSARASAGASQRTHADSGRDGRSLTAPGSGVGWADTLAPGGVVSPPVAPLGAASAGGGEGKAGFQRSGPPLQMVWAEYPYKVSGSDRTLHVESRDVLWGATHPQGSHATHKNPANPRAILYETIGTPSNTGELLESFSNSPNVWDVGLTLVLNQAYTPPPAVSGTSKKKASSSAPAQGKSLPVVKKALDEQWEELKKTWLGPPLKVATAAWERRPNPLEGEGALETVQSSVPYTTLRRLAATNPGAQQIEHELRSNHDHVWRKMGDSDMPILGPNDVNHGEIKVLKGIEGTGKTEQTNVLATFGYNLTSANASPIVQRLLKMMYSAEMELRLAIKLKGGPMYPSEPTTYYHAVKEGSFEDAWASMESVKVGGSGQQLEGAKLAQALKQHGGYHQFFSAKVLADTDAGGRNNGLIALLGGWEAKGDASKVDPSEIEVEINKLDQSAFRHNEYLGKVVPNMGGAPKEMQFLEIEKLIASARKSVAQAMADELVKQMPKKV